MYKVNVSIDDVCPHPKASVKVLDRCWYLIDKFPSIKFTLFIPMAYKLIGEDEIYRVDKYKDFCKVINELPDSSFELGWHGYNHDIWNSENKHKDREFRILEYGETTEVLNKMFKVAKDAGIYDKFSSIFRPPAFKLSWPAKYCCEDNGLKISGRDHVNVNPPSQPLNLFEKTEILYHSCEWDKSYLSEDLTRELEVFLANNLSEIDFVFVKDM